MTVDFKTRMQPCGNCLYRVSEILITGIRFPEVYEIGCTDSRSIVMAVSSPKVGYGLVMTIAVNPFILRKRQI